MSAADDALDVARLCPERSVPGIEGHYGKTVQHLAIAAAERVLVERGLGEEYGKWIAVELGPPPESLDLYFRYIAKVATAPLDARLRALARVVREKQQKENA